MAEHALDPRLRWVSCSEAALSSLRRPGAHGHDVLRACRSHGNAYVVKRDDFEQFLALVGSIQPDWLESVLLPGWAQVRS